MSMVSPLHPLFHAESCQADIQTLRWKDRPRPCPRCQRLNVGPWGTDHHQPGLKRDRCQETGCQRTFNDLTGTLLEGRKRSLAPWLLAPLLLCLSCSAGRMAKALGVRVRTGYRWGGGWRQGPCPLRSVVRWTGRSKPMLSITAPATRDRPRQAGRKRWVASHAGAATSASPGGATMTRIGQP